MKDRDTWTPSLTELLENKIAHIEYENELLVNGLVKMTRKYHFMLECFYASLSVIVLLILLLCL